MIINRFGRRILSLWLYAFLWMCIGLERITRNGHDPYPPEAFMGIHNWLNPAERGVIWIATAILAVTLGFFLRRSRWAEPIAFGCLQMMPLLNVVTYLGSAVAFIIPQGAYGLATAPIMVLVWGAVAYKLWVDAGWDEDTTHYPSRR